MESGSGPTTAGQRFFETSNRQFMLVHVSLDDQILEKRYWFV